MCFVSEMGRLSIAMAVHGSAQVHNKSLSRFLPIRIHGELENPLGNFDREIKELKKHD